jgi:hypothetical protein
MVILNNKIGIIYLSIYIDIDMLEYLWVNNNFDLENINSHSILDEMNPDIFSQLPRYEIFMGYPPSYPEPIKSIKLIVTDSNAVIPKGPFEYIISNAKKVNNKIIITDPNIISAFKSSSIGYVFDINLQIIYYRQDNSEIVVNNVTQYTK